MEEQKDRKEQDQGKVKPSRTNVKFRNICVGSRTACGEIKVPKGLGSPISMLVTTHMGSALGCLCSPPQQKIHVLGSSNFLGSLLQLWFHSYSIMQHGSLSDAVILVCMKNQYCKVDAKVCHQLAQQQDALNNDCSAL